jgi:glycosyltransferase involved in cell wall biosynthesis
MALYRLAYERAVRGMDTLVTISETVRKRFRKHLGHDSLVVYPPCETDRFQWMEEGDFYLSTARVDPLKRVGLIVKAFKEMPDKRLVVVSGGADLPGIRRIAEGSLNIEILGWVDETTLTELMGRCIATIYIPRDEDFGISPVESMAAGKPVIGVQEGALLETIGGGIIQRTEDRRQRAEVGGGVAERGWKDGWRNGWMDGGMDGWREGDGGQGGRRAGAGKGLLITECGVLATRDPGTADVMEAVRWMTPARAIGMRRACEARAKCFDTGVFLQKMRGLIEEEG